MRQAMPRPHHSAREPHAPERLLILFGHVKAVAETAGEAPRGLILLSDGDPAPLTLHERMRAFQCTF